MRERSDKCFTVATRRGLLKLLAKQWRVLAIVALVAASLASSPKRPYTPHEKAFYADDATVEYVLPGLTITINSAAIAANGTITVTYTLTDPNGLPLDAAGATTPGTISLSYVAAVLPNGQEDYTAYTTRTATGTVIASTPAAGRGLGRRGYVRRTRPVSIYFPHRGAVGIRRDGHAYHRHLWIAKLDGV